SRDLSVLPSLFLLSSHAYGCPLASRSFCCFFFLIFRAPPRSTLFPYTTLFRSLELRLGVGRIAAVRRNRPQAIGLLRDDERRGRSEEHTSELQSRSDLVCRLLLEKKKIRNYMMYKTYITSPSFRFSTYFVISCG